MKKALSLLLVLVMLLGMMPMTAFATEGTESTEHPEESEIPNGYVWVEYVESHGAESVDIGYSNIDAQRSYEYDITYSITNIAPNATKGMLGTLTIDSSKTGTGRYTNRTGMLCVRADGTTRVAFGSPAAVNAPAKWDTTLDMVNVRASVNVEQNTYTVWKDGMAVITDEVISGSPLSEHNWSVFDDSAVSEDPMSGTEYAEGRVYALKIWQDDELVRNLVPCYGRDEKEYGLYDLVEGVFYGDTNGGTLTGPDENGGCLVTLTAPEGVDVQVFSGFTKGSIIEPTGQETANGETTWTYSLSVGNYHFLSSGSDYYTLQKNFFVTAADVWDEDGKKHIDADPGKRSGDGWEYSSGQTRYEYTDELLASAAMDTTALREKYPEAVATPAFTISKADGAYTTQAEMEAFIAELDRAAENMYVYSAGASTNGHDLPLVVFTKKNIAGLELEDAAKLVTADEKPIIFFHAQIHGNEPAASEGALAIISGLCGNWGTQVLDQVNIIIMPRVNPDGSENYNRNNQAGKDLNRDNLLLVYPETRAVHRVYNLFEPEVVVDLHEYYLSTTSAIGNLDDYGIESSSNQSNTADLNSLSHELKYYVMGQTASEGIRGFDYYQSGYSNQNPLVVSHYYALRGSLGILIETPGITATKANFERRVLTDYVAARKIVDYVCNNSQKILETVTQDRASTTQKGSTYEESDLIVLKHGVNPTGNTFSRPTYDLTDGSVINANATDTCLYYEQILRSRSRPTAYVLGADTANISRILEIMDYHAISYYYLAPEEAVTLRGYASDGTSVVLTEEASITFESGAYVFPMNQSSGLVLALMMEPDVDKCDHNPITFVQTGVLTASDIYRCERNLVNGRIPGFHEHSYETTITAPTCTEQGYTTYTCECGDSYEDDYVDATGHTWTSWQQIAEMNCQGQGRWMRSCETCAAEQYTTDQDGSCVSFNSPAILANTGDTVVLTYYDVTLSADTVADAASIVWSSDQLIIDQGCVTPSEPGVYALTATLGTISKTVYLVVKAPGDTEYVLYFDDFTDSTLPGYRLIELPDGALCFVSDGKLILDASNSTQSYIRILLPEWIGDFGDYEISTTFTMTEALDSTKWFAVMARVQDEDYPYLQAPVRFNATAANGIELDQKNEDNNWVILHKTSYTEAISPSKYYTQTFGLSGTTGYHAINGTTLLESDSMAYGPGDVGFQVRGAVASIDSIKIVIPVDTSAHTLGDWTVTTAPSCTEPGTETRACSVCDYTETREVEPSHDLVQHEEKMHTCTESGWLAYETCTRCDYSTLVEVAPTGHSFQRQIRAIAHRGYSQTAPENTLASYELAKQLGYFYVECDIAFTADGIPVLLHDDTIDRTSDGTGKISELTYDQLLQYDFGSWKSADYAGTRIPTFEEFIALCAELDLYPYIELKISGSYTQAKVQQLVDIVEAYGMTGKVTWISFSNTFLGYVKNVDPTARLGYIYSGDATESVINTAKMLQTGQNDVFLLLNYSKITNTGILRAATNGFAIEVWTVNSESAILALPSYVSGVISDKLNAQSILVDSGITITAPTCTEQGYTTYTCTLCGASYVDDYVDATGHTYKNGTCTGCGDININWEIGTIAAASGANSSNATRLRTTDYLALADFSGVSVNVGYQLTWLAYDADKNYIGNGTATFTGYWQPSGQSIATADIQNLYSNAVYFRLALKAVLGGSMTLEDVQNSGVTFIPFGEALPEPEYELEYESSLNIGSWQDGAIWNGKLFVLGASGTGAVYDLENLSKLATFSLDSADVLKPHANSVCFGSTYYAPGDKYPLLYVNVYNNYASAADRMEGTCCVYRISETDSGFVTDLVQVIEIGFTDDLTLWKSKENNGDVRPYGNFLVDTEENKLYAYVMRDAAKATRFFKFDLPKLTDGIYSETYGCNVVTLESADIEGQFDTEYFNYLQGGTYSSGMIVSAEGFSSGGSAEPVIRIVNLETGTVSATYYMANSGLTAEPEVVCVDPATGLLYYAPADGTLRILTIPDVHFHSYENGTCTGCGAEHPNLTNYEGKVISILGASICTFEGYIPVEDGFNLQHYARYPQDNLLTDVNDTWWMQVINTLDAKLGINDSWRSTEVYNACTDEVNSSYDGTKACLSSVTRIRNLGSNGTPDVILFFGATNDITQRRPLGTFDPETAPTEVDLTTETWTTVVDAYTALIMRVQHYYPDAEFVVLLPYSTASNSDAITEEYTSVFAQICDYYGVTCIDLNDCGISVSDLPDGTHPDAEGMDYISNAVLETLLGDCVIEPGENVVHSVTHELTGAKSSLSYFKGISHGKSFSTAITGENVTVTVTMGGVDITDQVYADNEIVIPAVAGDIVITAKGTYNADGHLQQLPDDYCCNTNLWTLLDPVNEYYTASGWGNNSNSNYSVTFPVSPGDQVLATSFGAAGTNGYSANAVRITWFGEDGVLKSLGRDVVYAEFAEYGYITVPEGAVAVNIPMASNADTWEIYILSRDHPYENGICTTCGEAAPSLEGRTISILGASISTYTGISNNSAYNSTIGSNAVYYTEGRYGVYANDTWWMQVCSDLGLRLLVNNSWSGSSLLYERNGTVGAYVDRCVQLHNNEGEEPDIIGIQMGTNDFQYYKDTLGTADIDYDALIIESEDGSFTYATPVTSLEAAAIVLHKISVRYPNAEIYYLNISQRVDGTDELIRSFNAELKQVVEYFGAHIVDIYGSTIMMADFDTYIGDGRVHPNCLGMDAYTEAFKRALLESTAYAVDTHTVSLNLDGVTADYGDNKIVVSGDAFSCTLTAQDGKELSVSVTMGGEDITDTAYENGTISIQSVTADVDITAEATVREPQNYRWEFDGTDLVCVSGDNALTKDAGTTTDGVFSKTRYSLENEVVLLHDLPWVVEWKCEGTFLNTGSSSGARVFTSTNVNAEYNARYIFKSNTNGIIAIGEKTSSGSHNYGIALGDYGIDWTALHTYRLENRISDDGSNMIYLLVDGEEIGPMNHYYIGTRDQATTSDWLSGKDFVFPYMGTDTHGFTNASIDYIQAWEGGHTHAYEAAVTAPACTEQGYTTYTCTCGDSYVGDYVDATGHTYENGACVGCGVAQWDTDGDGVLEILAIGNSFSVDALEYAYQIAQNLGIQEIVLGNLYIGGCTLATHAANAAGDLGKYTYYYNDNGAWTSAGSYKISTALKSRSWDYVSMQQGSPVSGVESSYNEDLDNLIAYVQERSDAKLVWHMTWAYQQNSTHSAFPTYGSDQMTMYNAIVSAVQNKIATNSAFDLIVPNGTAVQNSRTSLLGDTTTRDGYHMSYDYGRYLTGLLFIKTVTGLSVDDITYAPSGVDTIEMAIAIESVNNASANPYAVTGSAFTGEIPTEGYIQLKSNLYKGGYWNPTDSTNYNTIITTASNSSKYFATIRFTRETLPVGSVIILEDGWQYRPDGWITDTVQTGSREPTTTESYVVVTEEWWGDYTIRAFNISKIGQPSLTDVTEEEVRAAFRIYVPEDSHIHTNTSVVSASTCTEQGYTTYTCTLCGDSYVADLVDANGHGDTDGNYKCDVCSVSMLRGDLNLDGEVDANDLTLLARHVAGIENQTDETILNNADTTGDGTVDADDLTMLARYVAGIITDWE